MPTFLAWTTTPWTLPSNVALCVNPDEDVCKGKGSRRLYLLYGTGSAGHRAWQAGNEETPAYEILETYKGKDLEYKEYEPLFDCAARLLKSSTRRAYYVVCDTYVTMTDGTGVVHIAPAFGEDDANVSAANTTCRLYSWSTARVR